MVKIDAGVGPLRPGEVTVVRQGGVEKAGAPDFHMGQVLEVELVRAVNEDEGLFRIAGRYFKALHPAGLAEGVTLPLKVVDTGPPLILKLPDLFTSIFSRLVHPSATSFSDAAQGLINFKEGQLPAGDALKLFSSLKELLALPQNPEELAKALEKFFRSSGIFHEALLARGETGDDLKSLALKLLVFLKDDEQAVTLLKSLLSHLETYQARSILGHNPVFPFALPWGEEKLKGEFEFLSGGEDGENGGGLVMKLDLPNLGHVESALWWYRSGCSVTFRLPQKASDFLAPRLPELQEILQGIPGLNLTALRIEPETAPRPATGRGLLEVTV